MKKFKVHLVNHIQNKVEGPVSIHRATHGSCRWADNPTCLDCHATDHMVNHGPPLQLFHTSHGSGPRGYVDSIPPDSRVPDWPNAVS